MGQELGKIALFDPVMAIRNVKLLINRCILYNLFFLDFNTKFNRSQHVIVIRDKLSTAEVLDQDLNLYKLGT